MAESINYKPNERVSFRPGKQAYFLYSSKLKLKLSWKDFAQKINVNPRTLNDWKREKYHIPLNIVKRICQKTNRKLPTNIKIKEPFWYTSKGARIGGLAVYKKYGKVGGDPEYRKSKWYEWWEREGKNKCSFIGNLKPIRKPRYSKELAEFVGIMIGDGGITKNQITISLNPKTDKQYIIFVKELLIKLFEVKPSVYLYLNRERSESLANIVISRKLLVNFCISIGLNVGNKLKQGLDIPNWIKNKKTFKIACLRGLVDTDGCFFNECHKIKGKTYCYPRLAFSSNSEELRSSVTKILKELKLSPKTRCKRNIQLEKREDIIRYFELIDTSNPKHKEKFRKSFGGVG